ncbi:TolC family protein [Flagellimonas amoyensis]|uniref:TolC family protein n=1 Tax=Flagellimonas amoyensis TaxID=2169401 RepID=UPI000D372D9C|nr:TolC family protein [Allomuricauda amoyensis]
MSPQNKVKHLLWVLVCLAVGRSYGQEAPQVLGFKEYLGYVKKYHPVAKQAQLNIPVGQANLMKARGGFDPKIEADYGRKEFNGTEYWDRLNTTFKIPTWFGIELKGNFQQSEGYYINPDETLPENGLYSAGVSMSLAQGFWINERMATLRKAKLFREQSKADQDLQVNQVLYNASVSYFDWLKTYRDVEVYKDFLENAEIRFEGIRESALAGDIAMIDTVEAKIAVRNRALGYEQAKVKLMKASLQVANFLWIDETPVELQPGVRPDLEMDLDVDSTLEIQGVPLDSFMLDNHPKIVSLDYKIEGLETDKRLKANKLLPKLNVEYNFVTETPELMNSFVTENYKAGLAFQMPLFLRKERGDLKLAKFKLRDAEFERDNAQVEIQNKITAIYNELDSYVVQNQIIRDVVQDYATLLSAEERKFSFGESSLFLINSREGNLIDAHLKQNEMENKFLHTKAKLFKSLAINPKTL